MPYWMPYNLHWIVEGYSIDSKMRVLAVSSIVAFIEARIYGKRITFALFFVAKRLFFSYLRIHKIEKDLHDKDVLYFAIFSRFLIFYRKICVRFCMTLISVISFPYIFIILFFPFIFLFVYLFYYKNGKDSIT